MKRPVLESFFDKVAGLGKQKRLQHSYFPVNIAKFLRKLILKNICEQLLLVLEINNQDVIEYVLLPWCSASRLFHIFFVCFGIIYLVRTQNFPKN